MPSTRSFIYAKKYYQAIMLIKNDNIYSKTNNDVDELQVKENLSLESEAKRKKNIIKSTLNQMQNF